MKIKVALLCEDEIYIRKLEKKFALTYADALQIYCFTNTDSLYAALDGKKIKIDVLLADTKFEINEKKLPKKAGFAYLVDSPEIDEYNNQRGICKFQKPELIFKQIQSVHAENGGYGIVMHNDNSTSTVIGFTSPAGGCGTSSLAAACAMHYAALGKRVLYLNFETFGVSDVFFRGEGNGNMSDVIMALKSKKTNLPMKLKSLVRQDESGVYFFAATQYAIDKTELTSENKNYLVSELKLAGEYDYVIIDTDFSTAKEERELLRICNVIVLVSDGSQTANSKISRAFSTMEVLEQDEDMSICDRMCIIYNKGSSTSGMELTGIEVKNCGRIDRAKYESNDQLMSYLVGKEVFDNILK